MCNKPNPSRWFSLFRRHQAGAGAVEFAIIAPVLLLLVFGGSELGVALTIDRKVKSAAGFTVDLVSQSTALGEDDLRKLFGISKSALAPYSIAPLKMRVTQIKVEDRKGTVDWSCQTRGYDALAKGSPVSVPPSLKLDSGAYSSRVHDRMDHRREYAAMEELHGDFLRGGGARHEDQVEALPHGKGFRGASVILAGFSSLPSLGLSVPRSDDPERGPKTNGPRYSHKKTTPSPSTPPQPSDPPQPLVFYVLMSEASYDFQPTTGAVFKKTIVLSGINYSLPRYSSSVESSGCSQFDL